MATLDELFAALQKADAAGNTEDARQLANIIRQNVGGGAPMVETKPTTRPEELGFGERITAAGKRGVESLGEMVGGLGLAKESLTGDTEAARARMQGIKAKQKLEEAEGAKTLSSEDIARIYKEKGLLSAAGQVPSYIAEQVVQSAPQMAGPLAVGAAVGAASGPFGVITGPVAGIATYGVQQFGNFLVRQAQAKENPEELEIAKAALTAAGTAPIGYFADRFTAGLGRTAGKEAVKELAKRRALGEAGAGEVAKEVGKGALKGAGIGIIAEAPTEVIEQVAERYQAGLSLNDEEAKREYQEAFFGAAAAGGGIGGGARGVQTYTGYRGELPAASAALQGAPDGRVGIEPGASQLSLPGIEEPGAATPLARESVGTELGGVSTPAVSPRVGEESQQLALDFDQAVPPSSPTTQIKQEEPPAPPSLPPVDNSAQIAELTNKIEQAQVYLRDPGLAEDQYNYAVAQIQQLQSQIDQLKQEEVVSRTETSGLRPKGAQSGFDFGELPEGDVQRTITPSTPQEFALQAETGMLPMGEVAPIEAPAPVRKATLGLAEDPGRPLEDVTSFLNGLKPLSANPTQVKSYKAEVNSVLESLREFFGYPAKMVAGREKGTKVPDVPGQVDPQEALLRAAYISDFFDQLSDVPAEQEFMTRNLTKNIVGMDATEQARNIERLLNIPNLNTYRGIQELRGRLERALTEYEESQLGEVAGVLPYKADEMIEPSPFVKRALDNLQNTPAVDRTPAEKAAYIYFTRFVSGADRFTMAMRTAAYDLAIPFAFKNDPKYAGALRKGETKENAKLFLKWVKENLPQQEYRRFQATVRDFRDMIKAGEKFADKTREKKRIDVDRKYVTSISRAPSGTVQTNVPKEVVGRGLLYPGMAKEFQLQPVTVMPMHPAVEFKIRQGDLKGALLELAGETGTTTPGLKPTKTYLARVAQKLAALPLTTTVNIGNQEALFDNYIKTEYGKTYGSLMDFLKFAYPEVHAVFEGKNVRDTFTALQMLKSRKFKGVDPAPLTGQIEVLLEAYGDAVNLMDKPAAFFPHLNVINFNPEKGGMSNYALVHEVTHAATVWALDPNNFEKLDKTQQRAVAELNKLYEMAREKFPNAYGVSDIYEFVAEALSNRDFQIKLRSIPYEGDTSFWDKFVQFISRLVGLNNVLGQTLINANQILMAPPALTEHAAVHAASGPTLSSLDGTRRVGTTGAGLAKLIGESYQKRPEWGGMKGSISVWLDSLKDTLRQHYLGAFTLRQLADMIGGKLPMFNDFINSVEKMLDDRNEILNVTRDVVMKWQKFQKDSPKLANILNKLMIDATVDGLDPSKGKTTSAAINDAWEAIGPEGQKIYNDVKKFYKDRLDSYIATILERKAESLRGKGIAENLIKSHPEYLEIQNHFKQNILEPYFPLRRFGKYWLQIGKGKDKEFYQFESALERNLYMRERTAELKKAKDYREVRAGNQIRQLVSENMQDFTFLKKLEEMLDVTPGASKSTYKANLEKNLEQLYLLHLPDQSVRKMFMNRKGIQGMNQDMLRAFASSAFHMAYQHSRFKFTPDLYKHLNDARAFLDGQDPDERKLNQDYIEEFQNRVDYITNPPDTGTIPGFLSNVSFIWYMTAPASALVNMLGVPAIGVPVVSAKFGGAATAKTMMKFAKMVGTSGFKDADGNAAFPSLMNKESKLTEVQRNAFERFVRDGLLDITLSHDIVGMAEAPSNLYTGRGQKAMQILSGAFHGAEKFNREVVAMSAFELAYERNLKNKMKPELAFEKAVDTAKELTYKSMFDYSTLNKPRYFQSANAKVIMQFKQFSQQMTYMLARSAYEGYYQKFTEKELFDIGVEINKDRRANGESDIGGAELAREIENYIKQMRKEGKQRLWGTLGMTFIFAGTTGLPGWWALSKIAEAVEMAFRDDDEKDKPFDFDNWFKNWAAETFGGFWGDSISRGVASQVSGVNLADRMGLNDLWFRDIRKSPDEVTWLQNALFSLLGPTAGLGISAAESLKQLREGYIWRATETATPAVIKNALKGIRMSDTFGEGRATTKRGDVLVDDLGIGEVLSQSIGFSPERLAQRQKANIETKTAEQEVKDKRSSLLNAYFIALDNQDEDMMRRTIDKIVRFNSSNPWAAIQGSTLNKSAVERYRKRALAQLTGGMNIDKKAIYALGGMTAYGNPDD